MTKVEREKIRIGKFFSQGDFPGSIFFLEGSFPGGFFHRTTTETNFNLNCTYVSAFLEDNGNFYGTMLEIVKD